MSITGQAPERGQSGAFLNRRSTPGEAVNFVRQTGTGTTSFSIASGATNGLTATFTVNDTSVPTASIGSENLKTWDETVIWPYFNFFVDTNNDFNYQIGTGASLSSEQKNLIIVSQVNMITPVTGKSATVTFLFKNNGASSHTLYVQATSKYIIIGE